MTNLFGPRGLWQRESSHKEGKKEKENFRDFDDVVTEIMEQEKELAKPVPMPNVEEACKHAVKETLRDIFSHMIERLEDEENKQREEGPVED